MLRPTLHKGDRVLISRRYLNSVAAELDISPSDLKKCTFKVCTITYSRLERRKLHYPPSVSSEGFADVFLYCEPEIAYKFCLINISVKRRELWKVPTPQKKSSSQVELERHMQEV